MRLGMREESTKKIAYLSPKNYATLQKAPVYLLMGTKDGWYTKEEAQDFFDNIVVEDKTLKFFDSGHSLPDEFISETIKQLSKE